MVRLGSVEDRHTEADEDKHVNEEVQQEAQADQYGAESASPEQRG